MHSIEQYNPAAHDGIIFAAAMEGVDINTCVGAERFIGYGDTKHGYGPACILDVAGTQHMAEPHVTWLPWVTPANKIVNFKWAMSHLAQTREVLLMVQKKEKDFFEHFVRRGLLRKVGYLDNLPEVEEIHIYQYQRSSQ